MNSVNNPFSGVAAVLFDLDGTLVETHIDFPGMKREMLDLAQRFGLDSRGLAEFDILGVVEEARRRLDEIGSIPPLGGLGVSAGERFRAEAFRVLVEIEVEQCANPVAIDGARELLRDLRKSGIKLGVVTRNCRRVAVELLHFDRLPYDALVTRDEVPRTKPDPLHLFAALEALGVGRSVESEQGPTPNASNAVMVGDNWMDVAAGRAAGMRTIAVQGDRPASHFDGHVPDLLVHRLSELLPLIPSRMAYTP